MQKFNEFMNSVESKVEKNEHYRNGALLAISTGIQLTLTKIAPYEEQYGEEAMIELLRGLCETFDACMDPEDLLENNS